VIVGEYNTTLSTIDKSSRQKVHKELLEVNDCMDLVEVTDVYRLFHPETVKYTLFSEAH
jgi:exonuclease III